MPVLAFRALLLSLVIIGPSIAAEGDAVMRLKMSPSMSVRGSEANVAPLGLSFTVQPGNLVAYWGRETTGSFDVAGDGAASAAISLVAAEDGDLPPPTWVLVSDGNISVSPPPQTTVGVYGPYRVLVSAADQELLSNPFSIEVSMVQTADAGVTKPIQGAIGNFAIAVSVHDNPTDLSEEISALAYDRADGPIVTHWGRMATMALVFEGAVHVDSCYLRFQGESLPSTTTVSINGGLADSEGQPMTYEEYAVDVTKGVGGYFTYEGPCFGQGMDLNVVALVVSGPDDNNATYTVTEFRVGTGGVYP